MSESGKDPGQLDNGEPQVATEDFISRWSQRKSEARQAQAEPPAQAVEDPEAEQPVLTDADMPPIESLDQDSDVSGFLSPGVSEDLRRMALRKMFHGAKFNITDGMDDYAEDYSVWEPLGDVVTCDMKFAMERMKEKLEKALDEATRETARNGTDEDPGDLPDQAGHSNVTTETKDDQGKS